MWMDPSQSNAKTKALLAAFDVNTQQNQEPSPKIKKNKPIFNTISTKLGFVFFTILISIMSW